MSQNKFQKEAERWLETAKEDLRAARTLSADQLYAHACFMAQQCGEKAVKAMWYAVAQEPSGQSIQKLVMQYPEAQTISDVDTWRHHAAVLDKFYSSTRYPNELPDLTPGQSYFVQDADQAIDYAQVFLRAAQQAVGISVNVSVNSIIQPTVNVLPNKPELKIDLTAPEFRSQASALLPPKMEFVSSGEEPSHRHRRHRQSWQRQLRDFVAKREAWIIVIIIIIIALLLGILLPMVPIRPPRGGLIIPTINSGYIAIL